MTSGGDKIIRKFDADNRELLFVSKAFEFEISAVDWSNDGKFNN